MNFQRLRQHCLNQKGAIEDFPFGDDIHVMKVSGKMFALLAQREGSLNISLKSEPEVSLLLREQYPAIKPGYHLNKRHWNTVEVDGSVPEQELLGLVEQSYMLVFKGLKKADREAISHA